MGEVRMRKSVLFLGAASCVLAASSAKAQSLDYGMMEEIFGQPVTTSATGKPQKVSEVPVNMEILTQDDIRRSGADNLPDVLQFLTGINFKRSSMNDGEVSIRGYDQPWNPRLLVLVNNRPVYEDFYGDVVWSAIPVQLDEIRQIEVVKGPNSALFGFNAASGVINIITFDPLRDNTNAITLRTGTQNLKEGSAVATAHVTDDLGIRLSVGGERAHEFGHGNLPSESYGYMIKPQNDMVNMDARWRINDAMEFTIEGSAAEMSRNFPADETPEYDRTKSMRGRLTAKTDVGLIDFDVYRNIWNINYYYSQAQQAVNIDNDVRVSDLFKVGADHSFRIGAEYKYNEAQGQFFNGSTVYYQIYSASAMWNWQMTPKASLTNAVRQDYLQLGMKGGLMAATGLTPSDYNNTSLNVTSFNSGLVYAATDDDTFRLMAARGLQLPSLNDLGQQIQTSTSTLYGQPHLRPTAVLNFEGGYDHSLTGLGAMLRTAIFRQYNYNLFGYDAMATTNGYQSANIGSSNMTGGEVGVKSTSKTGWRWDAGYSFAQISDHIRSYISPSVYTSYKSGTPRNTITAGLGYTLGKWELDSKLRWQDKYTDYRYSFTTGSAPVTIDNYVTVNARIGYNVTEYLTLAGTVDQLNQARIYERASTPTERRLIFSATAHF
jgi:iron complex outermembrane receptor protein